MLNKINIFNNHYKSFLKNFYENNFEKLIEINQKFETPKMTQTPLVKYSLAALRIYITCIVVMLIYKFILVIKLF